MFRRYFVGIHGAVATSTSGLVSKIVSQPKINPEFAWEDRIEDE